MKNPSIVRAYDRIQPDPETFAAIYERVKERARSYEPPKHRSVRRRLLLLAACVALLAALFSGAVLAYQRWSLPKPTPKETDAPGNVQVHESREYTVPEPAQTEQQPTVPSEPTTPAETQPAGSDTAPAAALDDAWFIDRARELLALVGLTDVQSNRLRVDRQTEVYWNREEAAVHFLDAEIRTTVRFRADTGELLNMTSIDWAEAAEPCRNDEEALALARQYYELLPVPQGYEFYNATKFDAQYWSFEFCRRVDENLFNVYEMVRLAINPVTGRMTNLNVFNVPLLDDHQPGDTPLTQAEAEQITAEGIGLRLENYTLRSAEIKVVMPNWWFSEGVTLDVQASAVTRLAWELEYVKHGEAFDSIVTVDVDLYTGEILGGGEAG